MKRIIKLCIIIFCIFLMASTAFAQRDDDDEGKKNKPPSYGQSIRKVRVFMETVDVVLQNIITDSTVTSFVNVLWTSFSVILLIITFSKYSFGGSVEDVVHCILIIIVAKLLLANYNYLTTALWDCSEGIAASIQSAVVGDSDPSFLVAFIHDVCQAISTNDFSVFDGVRLFLAGFIITTTIFLLSVLSFLSITWALWGYALAKIIGYFFIPCIMFRRLHFFCLMVG